MLRADTPAQRMETLSPACIYKDDMNLFFLHCGNRDLDELMRAPDIRKVTTTAEALLPAHSSFEGARNAPLGTEPLGLRMMHASASLVATFIH
ncbi:uncharacterized protein MYCFIDRAFT_206770 [Pseudocercospora fijiensis CIRAD86]|uniref:Uncharacterized protein n=1 Tax=Pseudocercospora fijiensis (strain CIRAD86) TaxID=383855 RepID=M2Z938_PSEFD|nr:uncharacterized protein MYCFIDRAFT_206770 [Pseudocercospora fijiensis CIRAD86]EME86290.1 hypothetical protein MYCFIDRAFT_206770 [Pseudocercospora fijiensis CIRAD86]